jgi:hypothetical protein
VLPALCDEDRDLAARTYGDPDLLVFFLNLAFGLGAELDAVILRKRHWCRVYFNRRCGRLKGCFRLLPLTHRICAAFFFFAGGAATRSVPERPDEHVRTEHREGLRLGDHEAM